MKDLRSLEIKAVQLSYAAFISRLRKSFTVSYAAPIPDNIFLSLPIYWVPCDLKSNIMEKIGENILPSCRDFPKNRGQFFWDTLIVFSVWSFGNQKHVLKHVLNMSRILAKLIIDRLKNAYEAHIGKEQFGFRHNRSTSDAIFITRMIIEKCQGTLVAVYIDLTAAYDHVPRDFLLKVLAMRTGATLLIAILKKMYEGATASIKGMKTTFDVLIGCRQGRQESPCIFNYYFDYVRKVAAQEIDNAFPDGWGIPS